MEELVEKYRNLDGRVNGVCRTKMNNTCLIVFVWVGSWKHHLHQTPSRHDISILYQSSRHGQISGFGRARHVPGENLVEKAAEQDEEVLEAYLETGHLWPHFVQGLGRVL